MIFGSSAIISVLTNFFTYLLSLFSLGRNILRCCSYIQIWDLQLLLKEYHIIIDETSRLYIFYTWREAQVGRCITFTEFVKFFVLVTVFKLISFVRIQSFIKYLSFYINFKYAKIRICSFSYVIFRI